MKISVYSGLRLLLILVLVSCSQDEELIQEETPVVECDLHDFTGSWSFIVDGDPTTEFIGEIHKFDDETLNIHYQPDSAWNHFLQAPVNCEDGVISDYLPAGNQGTKTIEGLITLDHFSYKDSTYINYTGNPDIIVKTIEGWRQ